jgi:hypothetical protein
MRFFERGVGEGEEEKKKEKEKCGLKIYFDSADTLYR